MLQQDNPGLNPCHLLGPSGIGKTKAIFDFAKERYCMLMSLDVGMALNGVGNPLDDIHIMISNLKKIEQFYGKVMAFEDLCTYELFLTVTARALVLLLWMPHEITPESWLCAQVCGDITKPVYCIRGKLRKFFSNLPDLTNLMKSCLNAIYLLCDTRPFIAVDEIQYAKKLMKTCFKSHIDPQLPCPLSTHIIRSFIFEYAGLVIAGTAIGMVPKCILTLMIASLSQQLLIYSLVLQNRLTSPTMHLNFTW
jgi:hypothetical protein